MSVSGTRVLVTGASGFVGQGLAAALHQAGYETILADRMRGTGDGQWITGDLSDPAHLEDLIATRAQLVFHLASLPGARAETDARAGWLANLAAPQALLRGLAALGHRPRVVFASSIAVLGPLGPDPVHEDAPPRPTLSYGAHKWMTEILLADLSRRGEIDGISLRLPGIVARPPSESGHGSAFMSQIFHAAARHGTYGLPVRPEAQCWWMARATLVANLMHAARLDGGALPLSRCVQLPVLVASVGEILAALDRRFGPGATDAIHLSPDSRIEDLFGRMPQIETPRSRALGFVGDDTPADLVDAVAADLFASEMAQRP